MCNNILLLLDILYRKYWQSTYFLGIGINIFEPVPPLEFIAPAAEQYFSPKLSEEHQYKP